MQLFGRINTFDICIHSYIWIKMYWEEPKRSCICIWIALNLLQINIYSNFHKNMYRQLWFMPFAKFTEFSQMHNNKIHVRCMVMNPLWRIHLYNVLLPSAEEIDCYSSFSNMMSTRLSICLLPIAYYPVYSLQHNHGYLPFSMHGMEWNRKMGIWIACSISIELCRNAWNVNYGPKIHNGNNNWVIKMHLHTIHYVLDRI